MSCKVADTMVNEPNVSEVNFEEFRREFLQTINMFPLNQLKNADDGRVVEVEERHSSVTF